MFLTTHVPQKSGSITVLLSWLVVLGLGIAVCSCGLVPRQASLSDPDVQPLLGAMEQVDRPSLGFTPISTNARITLEDRSRAGYDAMLHVYAETSRTIAFRKTGSGYRWIAEQEIHRGPKWHQTVDGTFREEIVIEFQLERVNGIPTNQLWIRYHGSDPDLLSQEPLTLSQIQPVLAQWNTAVVEPQPPDLPGAGAEIGPLVIVFAMLIVALIACCLALFIGVVIAVMVGAFMTAGIISISVFTGLLNKSVSTGFRVLFIQIGAAVGLLGGMLGGWGITWVVRVPWSNSVRLIVGGLIGVGVGLLCAWLFNKAWTRIANPLAAKLKLRRCSGILLLSLSLLLPLPAAAANRFAAPGKDWPNFLVLFSDDQTFRALGRLGELEVRTPNLDRLAKRGMLFTHCFNQGGWSGAVCIPSRTMLMTGRTLWQSRGTNGQGIAAGAALWGETLGQAGYQTFMAGKWHLPESALQSSFKTLGPLTGGFLQSTTNGGLAYHRPAPGNPWTPDDPRWKGHWLEVDGRTVHSSVGIADAAIDYLRTSASRTAAPFFMYVAFNAPHDPRQAPKELLDLYPPAKLKVPPNFLPKHPFLIEANFVGRDEILAPYPRTPEVIRVHLQEYYAIITHLDAQIGRVLEALEASGRGVNTVVIFTSDQGLAVGQHGLMGKQNLYDHSLRMPFIIAGPGIPKGRRNSALFNMQSLFATTCEMARVPIPESVQFPSIVPLITGAKKQLHEALYGAFLDRQRAIRTADWKLIHTPAAQQVQLFNVRRDPWETRNLAADPKHAATRAILDEKLRELMAAMEDPLLPSNNMNDPAVNSSVRRYWKLLSLGLDYQLRGKNRHLNRGWWTKQRRLIGVCGTCGAAM